MCRKETSHGDFVSLPESEIGVIFLFSLSHSSSLGLAILMILLELHLGP
jgi:hypothetical protein